MTRSVCAVAGFCLIFAACARTRLVERTESRILRSADKEVETGEHERTLRTSVEADRVVVQVQRAPVCRTTRIEERQESVVVEEVDGAGAVVAAEKNPRPPRREKVDLGKAVCGPNEPAGGEGVVLFLPGERKFQVDSKTDETGKAVLTVGDDELLRIPEKECDQAVVGVARERSLFSICTLVAGARSRQAFAEGEAMVDAAKRAAQAAPVPETPKQKAAREAATRQLRRKLNLLMSPYLGNIAWRMRHRELLPHDGGDFLLFAIMGPNQDLFNQYGALKRLDQGPTVQNMINLGAYARSMRQDGPVALRNVLGLPIHVGEALVRLAAQAEKLRLD